MQVFYNWQIYEDKLIAEFRIKGILSTSCDIIILFPARYSLYYQYRNLRELGNCRCDTIFRNLRLLSLYVLLLFRM